MLNINTVNTILYCKKWQETVTFYQTGLQLEPTFSNDWFMEFKLNDAARLSIANEAQASIKSGQGKGITLSIAVDDIEATHAFLVQAGLEPTAIKELWGSNVLYLYDPEGNRLEFWS
ncbi:MAG: VOC family protein [Anaerolineae bacterium]|nr:VOC family protein [Anaerolineae bacterium]